MASEFCLRDLGADDADTVAALIRAAFAAQPVPIDPPASALRVSGADVRAHLAAGGGGAVAVADVGMVGAILWQAAGSGLHVGRLAVAMAWRRRGLARALLGRAEAVARAAGHSRLWLETRLVLTGNRALFAAAGFSEISLHAHPGYAAPTFVRMEKRLA
jgi:predicted N-acetyltransferase YhbS